MSSLSTLALIRLHQNKAHLCAEYRNIIIENEYVNLSLVSFTNNQRKSLNVLDFLLLVTRLFMFWRTKYIYSKFNIKEANPYGQ